MVILGIDPGYGTIGYGIVRYRKERFTPIQYGAITTQIGAPMHIRLCELYNDLCTLIDTFRPEAAAVEDLFFNTEYHHWNTGCTGTWSHFTGTGAKGIDTGFLYPVTGQAVGCWIWQGRKNSR